MQIGKDECRMLNKLRRLMGGFVSHRATIRPGLYHYTREADGTMARFHLRVDAGGDGLLLANAAGMMRLSPSGVVIAKGLLEGDEPSAIIARARSLFRGATPKQIAADLASVESLIVRMGSPGGAYPILNLADPAFSPKARPLERPLSADVPLCPPFHMGQILGRLWQLGIPHVTIIVGRDPDEAALIRAVERAGDLGMIAGVRGRGSDLGRGSRIADMVAAGLDHLDVFCLSDRDEVHDALAGPGDRTMAVRALAAALKHEICPVAQIALVRPTLPTIDRTLEALARHGLNNVNLFAIATADPTQASAGAIAAHELPPAARLAEEAAERLRLRLLWLPTVQFNPAWPLSQQVCRGPRCGGDTAIRVEPDGSVIPARGPFLAAGNLIDDDWSTIEQSEVYQHYRHRVESDTHCDGCPGLAICAADCPREPAGWAEAENGESSMPLAASHGEIL
jgi:radical SAM protein with 4Fe4S-binding SPASM domain